MVGYAQSDCFFFFSEELSHRSPQYAELNQETMDILRRLLCVPSSLPVCCSVLQQPLPPHLLPSLPSSLLFFLLPSSLLFFLLPSSLSPSLPPSLLQENSSQLPNTPITRWRHSPVCCHTYEPLSVQRPGNRLFCNRDLVQQGCKRGSEVYEGESCSAQEKPVYKHTWERPVAADTRCSLCLLLRK